MLIAFCPAGKMEQFFQSVGTNPKLNAHPEFFLEFDLKPAWPSTRRRMTTF
jgi:hypothetical protein